MIRARRVAALLVTGALGAPPTASAGEADPVVEGVPMTITGFDATVAAEHGYRIVTLPDGRQASVPAAQGQAAELGTVQPGGQDTKFGNSYVELYALGGAAAHFLTGFHVSHAALSYHWVVHVHDTGGICSSAGPIARETIT